MPCAVGAFSEHVLIHVGNGECIRIIRLVPMRFAGTEMLRAGGNDGVTLVAIPYPDVTRRKFRSRTGWLSGCAILPQSRTVRAAIACRIQTNHISN